MNLLLTTMVRFSSLVCLIMSTCTLRGMDPMVVPEALPSMAEDFYESLPSLPEDYYKDTPIIVYDEFGQDMYGIPTEVDIIDAGFDQKGAKISTLLESETAINVTAAEAPKDFASGLPEVVQLPRDTAPAFMKPKVPRTRLHKTEPFTKTKLISAANKCHRLKIIQLLSQGDVDVNESNSKGNTALRTAVMKGDFQIICTLYAAGANPDLNLGYLESARKTAQNRLARKRGSVIRDFCNALFSLPRERVQVILDGGSKQKLLFKEILSAAQE